LRRNRFATKAEARREVARFIDWYNVARKHSTLLKPIPSTPTPLVHRWY
jgi:hypothetical protein